MTQNFPQLAALHNRKILVTGAGGFIGSHLVEYLVELGASVTAFVHYNALGSWGWLGESSHRENIRVIMGDVADRDSVHRAMQGTEIVFHLAALIGIPYSYEAPISYLRTNIEGTLNILQAARALDISRVIHTSTSEAYGTAQYVPMDEKHPLQGQSPYSASKIAADKMAEAFHLSFNLPVVTIRPFNTFGPRQSARAVIPTIIAQCLSGQEVKLGSLNPTRDLNFVTNTVEGFLLAAIAPDAIGKTINLGTGREISIGDLAALISSMIGQELKMAQEPDRIRPEKSEVERLIANNQSAQEILGWQPHVNLEAGLQMTIEWIRRNLGKYRTNDYNI